MSDVQDAYQACVQQAALQADGLMKGLIGTAVQQMFRRVGMTATEAERKTLQSAVRLLDHHEAFLCRRFHELLLAEFTAGQAPDAPTAGSIPAISFDHLELMDDTQVQERVEIARVQQAIQLAVEFELGELDRLICGAQGLETVSAERNPMRPAVYARALQAVLTQTQESGAVRLVWIQTLGGALGAALVTTYQALCRMLRDAGISPAGYLVVKAPGGAPDGTTIAGQPEPKRSGPNATGGGAGQQHKLLTLEHLRRLLAGDAGSVDLASDGGSANLFDDPTGVAAPPEFSQTVPAAFEALQEMKQVDVVIRRLTGRQQGGPKGFDPASAGGTASRTSAVHLNDSRNWGQVLALEVVSLMIDNMAGDGRLVEPVRKAVKALHPALMSLALKDPRFFSDRHHPARRLLAEITERGLGFDTVDSEGFDGFIQPVQRVVERLASAEVEGAEPFAVALAELHEQWASRVALERERREKAVQALLQAERRTLLANQISRELRERADLAPAAPEVVALLVGPWSQVMAQARLGHPSGDADPGGFGALVTDLLWSVQPELARRDRASLVKLIPRLIGTLREGLRSIEYPDAQTQAFLDVLMSLHQQALARGDVPKADATRGPMSRSDLEACFEKADESGLWVVPREAQDSGYFDSLPPFPPLPPLRDADRSPAPEGGTDHPGEVLEPSVKGPETDALTVPGAWIERHVDGKWLRSQLTWTNPQGNLFMYTGVNGRVQSMTLRSLRRLHQDGEVRLVAARSLVDGALDEVARRALRNSVEDSR